MYESRVGYYGSVTRLKIQYTSIQRTGSTFPSSALKVRGKSVKISSIGKARED